MSLRWRMEQAALVRAALGQSSAPGGWSDAIALTPFQFAAAAQLAVAIERWGGGVLADEVGLGKTHVALALLEAAPGPGLIVAPSVLVDMWARHCAELDIDARIITHGALSRGAVEAGGDVALVVVDEAHALVNPRTRRYRSLLELSAGRPVLMLSATPVGLGVEDLASLLRVFCPPGALVPLLGAPLETFLAEGASAPGRLEDALGQLVVRRTRRFIKRRWPRGLSIPASGGGSLRLAFPEREAIRLRWSVADADAFRGLLAGIEGLDEVALGFPRGLLRVSLLTRLESSVPALDASLGRLEAYLRRRHEALRAGGELSRAQWWAWFGGLGAEEDRQEVFPFIYSMDEVVEPDRAEAAPRIAETLLEVSRLRRVVRGLATNKAARLSGLLDGLAPGVQTLVFTRYVETARWLFDVLARGGAQVGLVSGVGSRLACGEVSRREVLGRFAPEAVGRRGSAQLEVLVSTDVLSEGLNLQRCGAVVSFDLPWNPRRLVQRHGRIDRLGPPGRKVKSVVMVPDQALDAVLRLMERLVERVGVSSRWVGASGALEALVQGEPVDPVASAEAALGAEGRDEAFDLACELAPLPPSPPPTPGRGLRLRATPRSGTGTLFVFAPGVRHAQPYLVFVEPRARKGDTVRRRHYGRLRELLFRAAEPLERPDQASWRVALTEAVRHRERLRAALLSPQVWPPHTAPARLLRQLAAAPPPPSWDTGALERLDLIFEALRGPLPAHLVRWLEDKLVEEPDAIDRWLDELVERAGAVDGAEVEELELLFFLEFRPWQTPRRPCIQGR